MSVSTKATAHIQVPDDHSAEARDRFQRELSELLTSRPGTVAVDCSKLKRVSAEHVSVLCSALQTCEQAGAAVRLSEVSAGLSRVLEVLDLGGLFDRDSDQTVGNRRRACRWAAAGFRRMYVDQFQSTPAEIKASSESFLKYLEALRLPEIVAFELQTVFYEIAMNICSHSYAGTEERIVFTAEADDRGIVMVFTDSGVPFDPTSHEDDFEPRTAAKERRKRGIGITLIKRLTDKITYCRKRELINVLTIEKHWS